MRSQPCPFDIVALAKRINVRREEWNRLHPNRPALVSPAMSRILENYPDYLPYRKRRPGKRHRPVTNPTIRTLVEIAAALGTTVGDLLNEPWPLSPAERIVMSGTARIIDDLIGQRGSRT